MLHVAAGSRPCCEHQYCHSTHLCAIHHLAVTLSALLLFAQIDHGHDASWTSELRQVCVIFVNLSPQENLSRESNLGMLQKAFESIYPALQKYEGAMNKIFMFDKVREVADSENTQVPF